MREAKELITRINNASLDELNRSTVNNRGEVDIDSIQTAIEALDDKCLPFGQKKADFETFKKVRTKYFTEGSSENWNDFLAKDTSRLSHLFKPNGSSSFKPNNSFPNSSSSSNSSTNNVNIDISSITNTLKKHLENELKKYFESTPNNNYNQESINSIINLILNELNEIKEKLERTNLPPSSNDNSEQITSVAKELERVKNELEEQYKKMSEQKEANLPMETKGTGTEVMWGLSAVCCLFFFLTTNEFRKIKKIVKRKK